MHDVQYELEDRFRQNYSSIIRVNRPLPLLFILASAGFVAALSNRIFDPVVPDVARDLGVSPEAVALLATVYAIPCAFSQPILGPLGDALGKARIIKVCLGIQLVSTIAAIFVSTIEELYVLRFVAGAAAGGIIPLSLAMVGDRFPLEQRQVALSRVLIALLLALLLGATSSGALASWFGWRAVLVATSIVGAVSFVIALFGLKPRAGLARGSFSVASIITSYARVFQNPRAI